MLIQIKYVYTGYGIWFNLRSEFSIRNGRVGKNAIVFEVDMTSSVHIDNKKKDISIFGKGPTEGLDDTKLTTEAQYLIMFLRSNWKFCSSLHYNDSNSFLFVHATKIYHFKAKDSEI